MALREMLGTLSMLALLASLAQGEVSPQLPWDITLGGPYGDGGWQIKPTRDGGYIVAGYTCLGQGSDLWVLKLNSSGVLQWERVLGGTGEDLGYSVEETDDGCLVLGSTNSFGVGQERMWLVKLDQNGTHEWDKTYGGFISSAGDGGWSISRDEDGSYLLAGYTRSQGAGGKDMWLVKVDRFGRELAQNTFGGKGDEVAFAVQPLRDGGGFLAGYTTTWGSGGEDAFLVRFDSRGREMWNHTFGGPGDDAFFAMTRLEDGRILLPGRVTSGEGDRDLALTMVDSGGDLIWSSSYPAPLDQAGLWAIELPGSGYLVCGRTWNGDHQDLLMVEVGYDGMEKWRSNHGGSRNDIGTSMVLADDGLLVLGITESKGQGSEDLWLLKLALASLLPGAPLKEMGGDDMHFNISGTNETGMNENPWRSSYPPQITSSVPVETSPNPDSEPGLEGGASPFAGTEVSRDPMANPDLSSSIPREKGIAAFRQRMQRLNSDQ